MSETAVIILAAGAVIVWLWLIMPDFRRRKECLELAKWSYAHRGLWDLKLGIPENSIPAFRRAVENGYAIELDIHRTADGRIVVFHDDFLKRMCGRPERPEELTAEELKSLRLSGTDCRIPLFEEVLEAVNGQVPLLIELKLPTRDTSLCELACEMLSSYAGPYLIESFNPAGLLYLRTHHPQILRGQLSSKFSRSLKVPSFYKFCSTALLVNALGRPHFLAYHFATADRAGVIMNRFLFRTPVFVWTIRSGKDYDACVRRFNSVIFEHILPDNRRF